MLVYKNKTTLTVNAYEETTFNIVKKCTACNEMFLQLLK